MRRAVAGAGGEESVRRRSGRTRAERAGRYLSAEEELPRLFGASLLNGGDGLGGVPGAAEAGGLGLGLVEVREGLVRLGPAGRGAQRGSR